MENLNSDCSGACSPAGNSLSPADWVELNASDYSKVTFTDVKQLYSSNKDITAHLNFSPVGGSRTGDVVQISAFGDKKNLTKPCCIVDIVISSDNSDKQSVTFPRGDLPKKTDFYQFIYMRNNLVLGASAPFYLQMSPDDGLSVSSEDDFLVVHQLDEEEKAVHQADEKEKAVHQVDEKVKAVHQVDEKEKMVHQMDNLEKVENSLKSSVESQRGLEEEKVDVSSGASESDCSCESSCISSSIASEQKTNPDSSVAESCRPKAPEWLMKWHKKLRETHTGDPNKPKYEYSAESLEQRNEKSVIRALKYVIKKEMTKNEELKKEMAALSALNSSLAEDSRKKDLELEKVRSELKEMMTIMISNHTRRESRLEEDNEKLKALEAKLENETQLKSKYLSEKKALEEELKSKESLVQEMKICLDDALQTKCVLSDQIENLTKENNMLQIKEHQLRGIIENLNQDYNSARKEMEVMKKQIGELQESEAKLKEENKNLRESEKALKEDRENIIAHIGQKEDNGIDRDIVVQEMQKRLAEAADLYKQQFIEIRSLKKQLKKLQISQEHMLLWKDSVVQNAFYARSLSEESSSNKPRSDSDTGEFIKTSIPNFAEPFENGVSANASCELPLRYTRESTPEAAGCIPEAVDLSVAATTFPAMIADIPVTASAPPVSDLMVQSSSTASASASVRNEPVQENSTQSQYPDNHLDYLSYGDLLNSDAAVNDAHNEGQELPEPSTTTVCCPYCDEQVLIVGDDVSRVVQHLHEVHDQLVCPVCGRPYDASLPLEYYQMHVESHFNS